MKKDELLKEVANRSGLTQTQANAVMNALQEVIIEECREKGGEVSLPQLGRFKQKINPAKSGTNPLTKKPMNVPESHTIKFTPIPSMKKAVEVKAKGKKK